MTHGFISAHASNNLLVAAATVHFHDESEEHSEAMENFPLRPCFLTNACPCSADAYPDGHNVGNSLTFERDGPRCHTSQSLFSTQAGANILGPSISYAVVEHAIHGGFGGFCPTIEIVGTPKVGVA